MAEGNTTGEETKTPLVDKQAWLTLYDEYCELLAVQQFYYEAMEGLAIYHHYPTPLRQGHSLITGWLRDQNLAFKTQLQALITTQ